MACTKGVSNCVNLVGQTQQTVIGKNNSVGHGPTDYGVGAFSMHSLRATAALGAGVADRLCKRHDHWWSESAKKGSVETRLSEHGCLLLFPLNPIRV